jgi:2'-deoxynucleoside 5'-phosphate N-hydrolase
MMKIFFSGSIRGGGMYRASYVRILEFLQSYGEVISEHLEAGNAPANGEGVNDAAIYARDVEWIGVADLLIAEVSQPSIGVGYEIALAESLGIPVLALYDLRAENPLSAMIAGNPRIPVLRYASHAELWPMLDAALVSRAVSRVEKF